MKLASPSQRVNINESPTKFEIVVSAKKSVFITLVHGLLIVLWGVIELIPIYLYFSYFYGEESGDILLLFLLPLTLFGAFFIYAWLYNLFGKERVQIKDHILSIKKEIFSLGITWKYDIRHVSNFRLGILGRGLSQFIWSDPKLFIPIGGTVGASIVFDYKNDTYQFGATTNEIEAQYIINELQKRIVITRSV